ncbi:MAG: NUDIX domain-containing protein [Candidatus Sungiibacteriota bacterium]
MAKTEREISAGAVIFRKEGKDIKFLLLYHDRGYWNFPKGKIEKGERLFQTFLREVEEETGIARRDMKIIPGFRVTDKYFFFREKRPIFKIVIFYLVETKKRDIRISHEHEGYGWFLPGDAMRISKFKNSKDIIRKAYSFIEHPRHPEPRHNGKR